MVKINCEISVSFDAKVNVIDSNIDVILGNKDAGEQKMCTINITPAQAAAIIDSSNKPMQYICSGKVQSYCRINNEFDDIVIQVSENGGRRVYTTDMGIIYQLKGALAQVGAINTLLGQ